MGAVYEAGQDRPRRVVAPKVVRPGITSTTLLKRFAHEAQILARLHHPGIAQVYEAGLADDGQPFFAMEFIRGLPLDEYANRHGLDLTARVALVARVCDAVQHSHDRGVIHRDLKPANILVEETGQPKVLDFGVARAADADLLTAAGLTRPGQLLGTPNYMSPDQVAGDPAAIDRRADVYALGIILFELAAHRLPYRLEHRPLAEAARLIVEQDPPRLSSIHPKTALRRGDDRGQGAGEGPRAALPDGGGPAALAGPRADSGAAGLPSGAVRPVVPAEFHGGWAPGGGVSPAGRGGRGRFGRLPADQTGFECGRSGRGHGQG
jgi:serine/threonine protein kinase